MIPDVCPVLYMYVCMHICRYMYEEVGTVPQKLRSKTPCLPIQKSVATVERQGVLLLNFCGTVHAAWIPLIWQSLLIGGRLRVNQVIVTV